MSPSVRRPWRGTNVAQWCRQLLCFDKRVIKIRYSEVDQLCDDIILLIARALPVQIWCPRNQISICITLDTVYLHKRESYRLIGQITTIDEFEGICKFSNVRAFVCKFSYALFFFDDSTAIILKYSEYLYIHQLQHAFCSRLFSEPS